MEDREDVLRRSPAPPKNDSLQTEQDRPPGMQKIQVAEERDDEDTPSGKSPQRPSEGRLVAGITIAMFLLFALAFWQAWDLPRCPPGPRIPQTVLDQSVTRPSLFNQHHT
jgi:hypothetical protein